MEPTAIVRALLLARKQRFGIVFRLPKAVQQILAYRPCALCAIEAVCPTLNGWIKIHASSFHFISFNVVLTWGISAAFSTFCVIRADLNEAAKDLIKKNAGGRVYYELDYDVIVFLGLTEPQAYLSWMTRASC